MNETNRERERRLVRDREREIATSTSQHSTENIPKRPQSSGFYTYTNTRDEREASDARKISPFKYIKCGCVGEEKFDGNRFRKSK